MPITEMTDKERLQALDQAEALIRLVERSYPVGDPMREAIFKVAFDTFWHDAPLGQVMNRLELLINQEENNGR